MGSCCVFLFPRIHFDRISDQLHTDIWTRLRFLVMFANVDFEVFKKKIPQFVSFKESLTIFEKLYNLYWHQLKSMIRGECDPITFTRTATASAALVVGIEPNPKNTSLWKMAKSQNSIIFVMITGCMMVCRIWGKDDDRKFVVFTEEGHATFCFAGVRLRNFGKKTLIWCSGVQTISGRSWVPHSEYHLVHHWTEPYNGTREKLVPESRYRQ